MTIGEALAAVQNQSISYRDAEVFLGHVLDCNRAHLHAHPEQVLSEDQTAQYAGYIARRETNEPVAYIIGQKEFYGRMFHCDSRALIPRPETEGVISESLPLLQATFAAQTKPCPLSILELGTGAGNISVTLGCELAKLGLPATIIATDISAEAIALAEENWAQLKPENRHIRLDFCVADLFANAAITGQHFDLITANLPYVEDTWKHDPIAQPDVIFYEPAVALFGGGDGLGLYRQFFQEAPTYLAPNGTIVLEYGETQTKAIEDLARAAFPDKLCRVVQDYAGLDRVLVIA